jgi:hypothetical protein
MADWTVFGALGELGKSDWQLRHVCLSVRMELFGLHWTDFCKIWYLSIFFENLWRR